jgi:G3E family GTPase
MLIEEPPERLPTVSLTLLAGFLGAGKTTLLNALVRAEHGVRLGVLVNDFGEIDIDAELVANVDGDTIALKNGCICCTIKDDLLLTLFRLLHRDNPPERVLIECSGVSDPIAVLQGFEEARLFDILRVDSVVAVVDTEQFANVEYSDKPLLLHQIVCADLVILNKTDLVDEATRAEVERRIRGTVAGARILSAERGRVPFDVVLGVGRFDPQVLLEHGVHHDHGEAFTQWSFQTDQRLDPALLREAIETLPVGVYRAKGIVAVPAETRRVVVQVVGRRVELEYGEPWGDEAPHSKFVAIGSDFDRQALTDRFEACRTTATTRTGNAVLRFARRFWPASKKVARSPARPRRKKQKSS